MRITELDFRKLKIQCGFRARAARKLTLLYNGLKFLGMYPLLIYMRENFTLGNETVPIYVNLGFGMGRASYYSFYCRGFQILTPLLMSITNSHCQKIILKPSH